MQPHIGVKKIWQEDPRTLGIVWTDETSQHFDVVELRKKCPCASCVDEWTRKPQLAPDAISQDVRPKHIASVGRYALNIQFSDGHQTGIYTFQQLRSWDQNA